jgi:hypothetical protein
MVTKMKDKNSRIIFLKIFVLILTLMRVSVMIHRFGINISNLIGTSTVMSYIFIEDFDYLLCFYLCISTSQIRFGQWENEVRFSLDHFSYQVIQNGNKIYLNPQLEPFSVPAFENTTS